MPLRYFDPNKQRGAVFKAWERVGRSRSGQAYSRHVGRRIDPWFYRLTGRSWVRLWGSVATAPLVTTGAKSGQRRVVHLTYFHDGSDPIVVASNYGGPKHPQWYYNLRAHPECELGDEKFVAAQVTDPDEYERLYGLAVKVFAGWGDYRAKTDPIGRHIPVFRLTPSGAIE